MNKEIIRIFEEFQDNFKEDFNWEEAEIWLESEMEQLFKNYKKLFLSNLPKKITDRETAKEIKNSARKLDDIGKQTVRAKNYGWNLCIQEIKKSIKTNL